MIKSVWQNEFIPDGYVISGIPGGEQRKLQREMHDVWRTIDEEDQGEFHAVLHGMLEVAGVTGGGGRDDSSQPVWPYSIRQVEREIKRQEKKRQGTKFEPTRDAPDAEHLDGFVPHYPISTVLLTAAALLQMAGMYKERYNWLMSRSTAALHTPDDRRVYGEALRDYESIARSLAEIVVAYYDEYPMTYTIYCSIYLMPDKMRDGRKAQAAAGSCDAREEEREEIKKAIDVISKQRRKNVPKTKKKKKKLPEEDRRRHGRQAKWTGPTRGVRYRDAQLRVAERAARPHGYYPYGMHGHSAYGAYPYTGGSKHNTRRRRIRHKRTRRNRRKGI